MTATTLAKNVAEFIAHNEIDITEHTMDEIVKGYFVAQIEAGEEAGRDLEEAAYWDGDFSDVVRYD